MGKDCLGLAIEGSAVGAVAGAGFGAVSSAWVAKPRVGQATGAMLLNTAGQVARGTGTIGK